MKKNAFPLNHFLQALCILGLLACLAVLIIASIPKWQALRGRISECVAVSAIKEDAFPAIEAVSGKININTAGSDELCTLYGVGPSKANAILAYREANGPFHYPQDIIYVSGIGETIYENNKDLIGI